MLIKSISSIQQHNGDYIFDNYIMNSNKIIFDTCPQVFEGLNINNQQEVAIKCVPCKNVDMNDFELIIKATPIYFPFILNLQDAFLCKENQVLYLVFSKCSSMVNNYFTTKKILRESKALKIFFQIVEGCLWLWRNNIAHCNINPTCIFYKLDEIHHKNVFMVSDFGVSTFKSCLIKANCDISPYMAPEALIGNTINYLCDVWSLGLVLHKLLFGEEYYNDSNIEIVKTKIMNKEYKLTEDQKKSISAQTATVLERMIKHNPEDRMTKEQLQKTCREFAEYEFVRKVLLKFQHKKRFFSINTDANDASLQYAKRLMEVAWEMGLNGYDEVSADMNEEALEIYQHMLGEDNTKTKFAMIRYAQDLMFLGKIEEAKLFGDKALRLYGKATNENNPDLARAYGIIGNIYRETGEYKISKIFLEKSIKMRLDINGEYHRDTAVAFNNLGCTLIRLDNLINTKEVQERSIDIDVRLFKTSTLKYLIHIIIYQQFCTS